MSLLQRVERAQQQAATTGAVAVVPVLPPAPAPQTPDRVAAREELLRDIRIRLQAEVMIVLDTLLDVADPTDLQSKLQVVVDRIIRVNGFAVTRDERSRLVAELAGEVGGLGPLDPLLLDTTITEIMVNGPRQVFIERGGKIEHIEVIF